MQVAPEDIWDPADPHKYYTPRDLGDNFIFLEKTSRIAANNNGGGGGGAGEEEVDRAPRKEAAAGDDDADDVGVYVLIETEVSVFSVAFQQVSLKIGCSQCLLHSLINMQSCTMVGRVPFNAFDFLSSRMEKSRWPRRRRQTGRPPERRRRQRCLRRRLPRRLHKTYFVLSATS